MEWELTYLIFLFSILCSVRGADAGNGIRIFLPDIGTFIASLTVWLVCRNMVQRSAQEEAGQYNTEFENEEMVCAYSFTLFFTAFVISILTLWLRVDTSLSVLVVVLVVCVSFVSQSRFLSLSFSPLCLIGRYKHLPTKRNKLHKDCGFSTMLVYFTFLICYGLHECHSS